MVCNILSYELNAFEKKNFRLHRPQGSAHYVFIYFKSNVTLLDSRGLNDCTEGACILYTPNAPQSYHVPNNDLLHDYVCFTVKDDSFFRECSFPQNSLFFPRNPEPIKEAFKVIKNEMNMNRLSYRELINSTLTKMFILLSRQVMNPLGEQESYNSTYELFCKIKEEIYSNPGSYNVELMAKKINFSRTYFTAKYKKYFKISPIDDLTNAMISKTKEYMLDKPVEYIAEKLDFDSVTNFYKWFRKHFGKTPKQYLAESVGD